MRDVYETEAEYQDRLARIAARNNITIEQAEYLLLLLELARLNGKSKRMGRAAALGYRPATKAEIAIDAHEWRKVA